MRRLVFHILISCLLGATFASAQVLTNALVPTPVEEDVPKVMAVYGVTADDYLPVEQSSREDYKNVKKRRSASRPGFDLPDAFYFIGGPIFLLILLRVLVIFLAGFEEKKKDEENHVASEHFNPE